MSCGSLIDLSRNKVSMRNSPGLQKTKVKWEYDCFVV